MNQRESGEYWTVLYQRAYAQRFISQDYSWKSPSFAMRAITGKSGSYQGAGSDSTTRNTIIEALQAGKAVTAATVDSPKQILDETNGLVQNHAYTILSADQNGITLRNPWGVDTAPEVRGTYNDGLSQDFGDGLIRITWSDYARYFDYSYTAVV